MVMRVTRWLAYFRPCAARPEAVSGTGLRSMISDLPALATARRQRQIPSPPAHAKFLRRNQGMKHFTRRQFVSALGAGTIAMALDPAAAIAQSGVRLRCFWWGNPDRDKRTRLLLDTYSKKSNTQIAAESLGWGDYWTKLGTQTAGGNAPDLIQMD